MKKIKLKYHFHDPNPPDKAADYILKVLIEVNVQKAESAIKKFGRETQNIDLEKKSNVEVY